jgi:hypothetical protein
MADRGYLHAAPDVKQVPPTPTVRLSVASGLPSTVHGDALSISSFAQIRPLNVYEIGSSWFCKEVWKGLAEVGGGAASSWMDDLAPAKRIP